MAMVVVDLPTKKEISASRPESTVGRFAMRRSSSSMLPILSMLLAVLSVPGTALNTPIRSYCLRFRSPSCSGYLSSSDSTCGALFSSSGYIGGNETIVAAVPVRKAKHKSRKKPQKRQRKKSFSKKGGPLSEREVGQHVASQYVRGTGGLFHHTEAKRQRMEDASQLYHTDPSHRNHANYLKKLDGHPALVLNADYQPLSVLPLSLWSWQDAVKAVFTGKVTVVDFYSDINVRAVNLDVPLPSVIALNEYAPRINQKPAFTRRNVYLRDSYRCQYCSQHFRTPDLSLDHYVPRSRGGRLNWENTVTCCRKCNGRKGSRMPAELGAIGMRVLREPRVPSKWELAAEAGKMLPRKVHPTWAPYLGLDAVDDSASAQREDGKNFDVEDGVKAMFEDVDL